MKGISSILLISLSLELVLCSPAPPRARLSFSRFRNARQDTYGPAEDSGVASAPSGPYPPSGWKPNGELLLLPGETHSSQQDSTYGAPPPSPPNSYGPAETTTSQPNQETTTSPAALPEPDASSQVDTANRPPSNEEGQYYVLLPDGKLQKVKYSGKQKGRGQYEAQVEYEVVDPVRAPIYSYQGLPLTYQ